MYFYEYSGNQNTEALYLGKYHERGDLGVTTRRDWLKAISLALGVVLAGTAFAPAQAAEKVTVFAAASLKNALDAINGEWLKQTGKEAIVSYAASSALAKQIEQGAPADVFISADLAWMDYLADKKLIKADTRSNLLGNRIVLVSGKSDAPAVEIEPGLDLAGLLGDGRLAMGAVDSVPAGKYGKAALEKLGLWPNVAGKVAGAESVRACPPPRVAWRGALRHRLPNRRRSRCQCESGRHLPRGQPPANHLPGRDHHGQQECRCRRLPRIRPLAGGGGAFPGRGLHGSGIETGAGRGKVCAVFRPHPASQFLGIRSRSCFQADST